MILKILEGKGAHGTFFCSGFNISRNKELTKDIAEQGHLVGNHFLNHRNALLIGRAALTNEIMHTKEMVEEITGKPCNYLRPPYGIISPSLLTICRKVDISVVLWNVNTFDYRRKSYARIIERVLKKGMKPGSIILFHECNFRDDSLDFSSTIKALRIILDILFSKNIEPVTIHELLEKDI
jgi:peptidoglycan/xylan/chitin deacetylase (PgdA/CDA1 family)